MMIDEDLSEDMYMYLTTRCNWRLSSDAGGETEKFHSEDLHVGISI